MAARLQHQNRDYFAPQFQDACVSLEGRQLAEIIDRNEHVMIQVSLLVHPALAPILSLIPDHLTEALADDRLMKAFGHMARLEMNYLGFFQVNSESDDTRWPFNDRISNLAIFRRGENGAAE